MNNRTIHKKILKAALIAGCFFMCACENDDNEVRDLARRKTTVEEGKNINSYLSMDGKMKAHLTAPVLLRFMSDSGSIAEFPKSLHVEFYNDSTKIQSELTAHYGRYMENQNKVYLRDSVVVFNTTGDTLFCNDLYWDQAKEVFYSNKEVTYSRNHRYSYTVGLNGMTAKQDLSSVTFFKIAPTSYAYVKDSTATDTTAKPLSPPKDSLLKRR
jgi:LPS export ABC transporter protein LptC